MASLDALPVEIQLNIFRRLIPEDSDKVERDDLASLRLTCTALRAAATEVYFQDFYLLLRKEDNVYVESRSFQQLLKKPHLAALVQRVWIALAAAEPDWLRQASAFGHCYIPDEGTALEAAYKATDIHKYKDLDGYSSSGDEVEKCKEEEGFTSEQCDTIREYYRRFIQPPAWENQYSLPVTSSAIEVVLKKRLRSLPNLRHLRVVRPLIKQTPFFEERFEFLMNEGLENWAFDLSEPRYENVPYSNCFPWHPVITKLGLELIPSTCNSLELDILLHNWPFDESKSEMHLPPLAPGFCPQVVTLRLLIDPFAGYFVAGSQVAPRKLAQLWNRFELVTSLSLHCNSRTLTWNEGRDIPSRTFADSFLPALFMAGLQVLSLQGWVLRRTNFVRFRLCFPSLQTIHLDNVALETTRANRKKKRLALWLNVALRLNQDFGTSCSLSFGKGPFMEFQGCLNGDYGNYSFEENPAITRILKLPALEVLSDISQSLKPETDLTGRYAELVRHKRPKCRINSWDLDERETDGDYEPHVKHVETMGVTAIYYEVLRRSSVEQ